MTPSDALIALGLTPGHPHPAPPSPPPVPAPIPPGPPTGRLRHRLPNATRLLLAQGNLAHLARTDTNAAACDWWRAGARRVSLAQAHVWLKPVWCTGCFPGGNPA